MPQIFISHTEKDAAVASSIAQGLEQAGYRVWSYKRDAVAALTYLAQTKRAIEQCKAMVLIISPSALQSNQVGIEVIRAHELNKRFVPVLHGLTHEEFRKQEPEWGAVLGAAVSTEVRHGDAGEVMPRILAGLKAVGIEPGEPEADRVASIGDELKTVHGLRAPRETVSPDAAATSNRRRRLRWLGVLTLALLVVTPLIWLLARQRSEDAAADKEGSGSTAISAPGATTRQEPAGPIVVGVMDFEAQDLDPTDDWMPRSTRDSLNTILSNVHELRVYAKEKIDFLCGKRGLDMMECADKLAMTKVVRGKLSRASAMLTIEVRVIDIQTGFLDLSFEGRGSEEDFITLQNDLAMELLQKLGIEVSDQRRQTLLASRTNDAADSIKLLSETLSDFGGKQGPGASLSVRRYLALLLRWTGVAPALAGEGSDEDAIRAVVQRYGAAIQAKDMNQLALVLVDVNSQQRSAHERYFESANDLTVEISNLEVLIDGEEAMVTFTRKDLFKESKSGRDRILEVRLNSLLKKEAGTWKIASFAK